MERHLNISTILLILLFVLVAQVFAVSDAQFSVINNGLSSWQLVSYTPPDANVGSTVTANPTLNMVIGKRYEITNPNFSFHPFELIAKAGTVPSDTVLLSQRVGTDPNFFESDPNVGWVDTGTAVVAFTLTQALANAMTNPGLGQVPGYRCGIHTNTMRGNINIKAAPVCGDSQHQRPLGDLDQNCYVNFVDFAIFAQNWLDCTDPQLPCGFLPWPP